MRLQVHKSTPPGPCIPEIQPAEAWLAAAVSTPPECTVCAAPMTECCHAELPGVRNDDMMSMMTYYDSRGAHTASSNVR